MSPYMQLKSPFRTSSPQVDIGQGLDRKAEYIDKYGVLRRSSSVTCRMIQQGISINDANDLDPDEQLQSSLEDSKVEKDSRASMLQDEDALRKAAANAAFKYSTKMLKDEEIQKANQRIAERSRRCDELRESMHEIDDLVDVTENCTATLPSKTNTYIDQEGNLRRRISVSPEDGYIPGPETPPAPATKVDEPRQYC
ncbi:hypothetical protein P3T76_005370 [Phytophthora citrophthora]|uniref:Uncharacterized protein n=1 Tax=Phytophthora citrophthora TaxID=4793 RepID=A0AAD9LRC7_9STRA|nr:hypothetical protein P3T76_005370 [Phytophthora citrophthora]